MAFTLDGFREAAQATASWAINASFRGVSLAGSGLGHIASLSNKGVRWAGHGVNVISVQAKDAVIVSISKTATTAFAILAKLATLMLQGLSITLHLVKTHPKDVMVGLGSAAATVALILLVQNSWTSKKEAAPA